MGDRLVAVRADDIGEAIELMQRASFLLATVDRVLADAISGKAADMRAYGFAEPLVLCQ